MIPRIFHFVFGLKPAPEPLHLMHYLCLASCLEVNRPDAVFFHYHHEPTGPYWRRIRARLHLRKIEPDALIAGWSYADACVAQFRYAHLSDVTRLQILREFGGIYADLDTLFLRPVPDELWRYPAVMGREEPSPFPDHESLCNAWIAAEPGAPFIGRWLDGLPAAFDGSWSRHSTLLPAQLARAHPEEVRVEPPARFYDAPSTREGLRRLFEEPSDVSPAALSIHLWSHLWWSRWRTDFSTFHAGRITPGYVAHANATYARLARPFLDGAEAPAAWRHYAHTLAERCVNPLNRLRDRCHRVRRRWAAT